MRQYWIDDGNELEQFCAELNEKPISLDTESDHFHAYQAQVCLFQVAQGHREALIDPLDLDQRELKPLFEVLRDPEIVKILHAARNDINEIDRDYGVGLRNLFDTQIAARFVGTDGFSLDWMLEELLDLDAPSGFKQFDWTTRPLPDRAKRYAVTDVRYLENLRDGFLIQLDKKDWLEPFHQYCEYIAGSVSYEANEFDPEGWRSIDGSDELDGSQRAALEALYRYRHELCRDQNRSAVTFFPNGALFRLSVVRPTSGDEVGDVSGVPRELAEDHGEDLAEVIRQSRKEDPPPQKRTQSSYERPPEEQSDRYDALRQWRNETAKELEIPTEFIATNDTLSKIVANPPDDQEDLATFDSVLPWQVEQFGEEILQVLLRTTR